MPLAIPEKTGRRWDLVALGEVMLRFDPGDSRIHTSRSFNVWEGGGEYNVARGLKRCFGLDTALVSAFADNPIGRLVQDLIYQGGVDQSHVRWVGYDGVGRAARNGLNFVERGFGIRAGVGCSDRGHTAVSQLKAGDIDWNIIFEREGARALHTGGIFCALSQTTPDVAREAMDAARSMARSCRSISTTANRCGGRTAATSGRSPSTAAWFHSSTSSSATKKTFRGARLRGQGRVQSIRRARSRSVQVDDPQGRRRVPQPESRGHDAAAREDGHGERLVGDCLGGREFFEAPARPNLEILDRIGGGDSFASGLLYGLMTGRGPQWAVECGAAHGALAMTTPGDTSTATLAEVERAMKGGTARVSR